MAATLTAAEALQLLAAAGRDAKRISRRTPGYRWAHPYILDGEAVTLGRLRSEAQAQSRADSVTA